MFYELVKACSHSKGKWIKELRRIESRLKNSKNVSFLFWSLSFVGIYNTPELCNICSHNYFWRARLLLLSWSLLWLLLPFTSILMHFFMALFLPEMVSLLGFFPYLPTPTSCNIPHLVLSTYDSLTNWCFC